MKSRWPCGGTSMQLLQGLNVFPLVLLDICNARASFCQFFSSHNFHMIMSAGFRARPIKSIISEFIRGLWNDSMQMKIRWDVSCSVCVCVCDFWLPSKALGVLHERTQNEKVLYSHFFDLLWPFEFVHVMFLNLKAETTRQPPQKWI